MHLPKVGNGSDCFPQMASILGPISRGSAPISCLKRGATIAPNLDASASARRILRAQLDELIK